MGQWGEIHYKTGLVQYIKPAVERLLCISGGPTHSVTTRMWCLTRDQKVFQIYKGIFFRSGFLSGDDISTNVTKSDAQHQSIHPCSIYDLMMQALTTNQLLSYKALALFALPVLTLQDTWICGIILV